MLSFQAFAQPPYSACFNADTVSFHKRGCAPLTVKMINCSQVVTDPTKPLPVYDFGDGPLPPGVTFFDTVHTYTKPGIYSITQTVSTGANPPALPTNSITKIAYIEVKDSPLPDFSVQICKNMLVNVKLNNSVYDQYIIDFGDGTTITSAGSSVVPHTYALPVSSHTIKVTGNYLPANCGASSTASVTPLSNLIRPDMVKLVVNNQANGNGNLTLTFTPVSGQKYFLEQSTGNNSWYTIIDTLPANPSASLTISKLNTLSTQYCYRISAYDDCGDTLHSPEVCSETIIATASNNQNQINWSNYSGNTFFRYLLYRNGQALDTITSITSSSYTDNNVRCGSTYCYSLITEIVETTNAGNRIQSISDTSCVKAISQNTPAAIQNLNSTISGSSVKLSWDKPTAFSVKQYQIKRSVNGGSFSNYATSATNTYTDNSVDVNAEQYCYKINYTDSCGQISASGSSTCPVLLQGNEAGSGIVDLSWNSYTGCSNGIQDYTLLILNPSDNTVKSSVNIGLSNSYTDNTADPNAVSLKYQIKATCSGPDTNTSFSNIFEINHNLKLFLPDAFTPDGDGVNDVFIPKGKYVQDFKMTIFNRWGEIVFYTDKFFEGWDGNYKGEQATSDAYAYMIEVSDYFGKKVNRKGTVTLLR
jgi:gliding motility-associated-like protein